MAEKCWEHYRSCPYNDGGWYCLHHGGVCDTWAHLQEEKEKKEAGERPKVKYEIEIVFGRPLFRDEKHKVIFEGVADNEDVALSIANTELGIEFKYQRGTSTYIYKISENISLLLRIDEINKENT